MSTLDDLRDTLTHARLCHEGWWLIEGDHPFWHDASKIYNRYADFFYLAVSPALFATFMLKLASVFDEDNRSISLKDLPDYNRYPGFQELWSLGRVLFEYRNKVIAHRSRKIDPAQLAADTGFTYDGLKKLLDDACSMFDNIATTIRIEGTHRLSCRNHLHSLIKALDQVN